MRPRSPGHRPSAKAAQLALASPGGVTTKPAMDLDWSVTLRLRQAHGGSAHAVARVAAGMPNLRGPCWVG